MKKNLLMAMAVAIVFFTPSVAKAEVTFGEDLSGQSQKNITVDCTENTADEGLTFDCGSAVMTAPAATTTSNKLVVVDCTDSTAADSTTDSKEQAASTTGSKAETNEYNYYTYNYTTKETTSSAIAGATATTETKVVVSKKLSRPTISVKTGTKSFVVSVNRVNGADGYQIKYLQGGRQYLLKTTAVNKKVFTAKNGVTSVYVRAFSKTAGKITFSKWSKLAVITVK